MMNFEVYNIKKKSDFRTVFEACLLDCVYVEAIKIEILSNFTKITFGSQKQLFGIDTHRIRKPNK